MCPTDRHFELSRVSEYMYFLLIIEVCSGDSAFSSIYGVFWIIEWLLYIYYTLRLIYCTKFYIMKFVFFLNAVRLRGSVSTPCIRINTAITGRQNLPKPNITGGGKQTGCSTSWTSSVIIRVSMYGLVARGVGVECAANSMVPI